jgi:(2Fe-2S) ferredoxin
MGTGQYRVFVCTKRRRPDDPEGSCCQVGAIAIYDQFAAQIQTHQLGDRVDLRQCGCLDRCDAGPVAMVVRIQGRFSAGEAPPTPLSLWLSWLPTKLQVKLRQWLFPRRHTYGYLTPQDVPAIVQQHLLQGKPLKRCQL